MVPRHASTVHPISPTTYARVAGLLYLTIWVSGVFSELVVRTRLVAPGDAAATADNIAAAEGLFRIGFVADLVMALSDVGLAVLLFVLLAPISRTLAMVATAFRLTQTAVLAGNLLNQLRALLLVTDPTAASVIGPERLDALALSALDAHSYGYLIGLTFFGVHMLLLAFLLLRSRFVPRILAIVSGLAAVGYLTDSFAFFLLPTYDGAISPIILAPAFVGELALALWLLVKGIDVEQWRRYTAPSDAIAPEAEHAGAVVGA